MENLHTLGMISGILAAFVWAVSSVMFRNLGLRIHPLALNLYKGAIAAVLLLIVLIIFDELLLDIPYWPVILLLVSGMIGIGVGDTAFFAALNRLGERQTILIAETIAPVITFLLATWFFQEYLSFISIIGMLAILAGVIIVVIHRDESVKTSGRHHKIGIAYGLIAAGCQAIGAILTKAAFLQYFELNPMYSALIRLAGGIIFLIVFIPFSKRSFFPGSAKGAKVWYIVILASVIGTFGGLIFQQIAFKFTYTAIAQILIATSVVIVFLISFILGHRPPLKSWAGAILAFLGVCVLYWFRSS